MFGLNLRHGNLMVLHDQVLFRLIPISIPLCISIVLIQQQGTNAMHAVQSLYCMILHLLPENVDEQAVKLNKLGNLFSVFQTPKSKPILTP